MRFAFLGGPACGVDTCHMFGLVFPLGVAVEVGSPHAIRKLQGNQFFAVVHDEEAPVRRGRPRKERV